MLIITAIIGILSAMIIVQYIFFLLEVLEMMTSESEFHIMFDSKKEFWLAMIPFYWSYKLIKQMKKPTIKDNFLKAYHKLK